MTREQLIDAILRRLGPAASAVSLDLALGDASARSFAPDVSDPEADLARSDALRRGAIHGQRHEGDGTLAYWTGVQISIAGLRSLGEWPPAGVEALPGPWDDRYWGTEARPLLAELRDRPPAGGVLHGPAGEGEDGPSWPRWRVALLLAEGDLIDARLNPGYLQDIEVTEVGREALDGSSVDPLDRAQAALAAGWLVETVITAGAVLDELLSGLAARHGIDRLKAGGKKKELAAVNNELRAAGAYGKDDQQQILAWLVLRNRPAHELEHETTPEKAQYMLDGVRLFRSRSAAR
jgi:hypothetical protein